MCDFCSRTDRMAVKPTKDTYDTKSLMFLEQYSSDRYLGFELKARQYEKKDTDLAKEGVLLEQTDRFEKYCATFVINFCPMCGRKL